jgi:quercetin dioxygenase-like cupin family protein
VVNNAYIQEYHPIGITHRRKPKLINIKEWGTFTEIGAGQGFHKDGRFYTILETKKGAYRGNHTHPVNQYTLLISGKGKYVRYDDSITEIPLVRGEIVRVEAGVPHIMVPEEDCFTFEWWDGDFVDHECQPIFGEYTGGRIGPDKLRKR